MYTRLLNVNDTQKLEVYLAPHTSQCMFMCSNLKAAGIEYQGFDFQGEYYGCLNQGPEQADRLDGVMVHYWNGTVMMHASNDVILERLTACLKNNTKRPIAEILGPQAEQVINSLGLSNACFSLNNDDALYEKDLSHCLIPLMPENSIVMCARDVPRQLLYSWMEGYEVEAFKTPKDHQLCHRVEAKVERLVHQECWVLRMGNNTFVSLVGFNARLENSVQLGPVWTPPEHRRQGFAKVLLSYVLAQEAEKRTQKAILFTESLSAIKIYESLGFTKIGHYRVAVLKDPVYVFPEVEFMTPPIATDIDFLT